VQSQHRGEPSVAYTRTVLEEGQQAPDFKGATRTDNAKWFYASIGGAEKDMRNTLRRGGSKALNLYSTTAGPNLG